MENVGSGPFSLRKGPGHISHLEPPCTFFPNFGKAIPPDRDKIRIQWVSRKEQARLAVLALQKFIWELAEQPELQLLLQD